MPLRLVCHVSRPYEVELNRDRVGYEIGPHTDSQAKWVTTLYYLAKDLAGAF
jgi:hypothetical protein